MPETAPQPARRSSGIVTPQAPTPAGRLAARLIQTLVRAVGGTLRYAWAPPAAAKAALMAGPVIFAIWHNRLALSLLLYRRYVVRQLPNRRMAALVSASRDGGMLAHVLELFEVQPVRGSSSRRGPQALLELTSWAERGYDLAITPDGPRGPRYVVQNGVVAVAQTTGLPILPVSVHLPWKHLLRSWDRFQVPLPFGRCRVSFGEVVRVPRETGDAERESLRRLLEDRLRAITQD
ncbi:MAG: DUF374 domain-containing protein [Verrucomicrobia bacterium]|nr:DUF374 domain-containing protein [Verrucomicrobiota bacterium]